MSAHILVLLVLRHEPRGRGDRTEDDDSHLALNDTLELRREGLRSLQLESPHWHIQVEKGVGSEDVLPGVKGLEDVGKPLTQVLLLDQLG